MKINRLFLRLSRKNKRTASQNSGRPSVLSGSIASIGRSLVMATGLFAGASAGFADTLYHANSGAGSFLDGALTTPAAPGAIIQNYAEGVAFTAADTIAFNNLVTAATAFNVSTTAAFNLATAGFVVLNPGGAITINNNGTGTQSQTVTIGGSGIDMSNAAANLTFATTGTGVTLTVATSADQTWLMRTGRTLSLAAVPLTLANNVTIRGAGTVTIGNATAANAISGAGNLTIEGSQSGGGAAVLTLSGNNSGWTGITSVGLDTAAGRLRTGVQLNIDQLAAAQNKLADGQALAINHATVNLQGTLGGTETVASVSLGSGLNVISRSAGTGVLQANAISFGTGAALNFGSNGTTPGTGYVTTDNLNNNLILGARAVAINGTVDTNWVKNSTGAADGLVVNAAAADYTTNNALDTWTVATDNILMNATGTASTASRTINSLKIAHATATTAVTADIGAGNTLTINDGFNGGGIIRNQNAATTIGNTTIGAGSITAGAIDDSVNDTLYLYNSQNTMTINNVIKDNNTGAGTDTLHLFTGGNGTVVLNAINTFTGGITIGAGTLTLGANSVASNDATLGTGNIVNFGTLLINKSTAASDAQMTFANNITGTGVVTINRDSAIFSGVNDYSGATNVAAATTLRAGSATGISANSRMILNAATATLDLNGFDSSVAALRGDNATATVTLGANALTLSGSDLANSGSAETLTLGAAQSYIGGITGTGNLIKNGGYTQVLTSGTAASNLTYTGTTTVNGGILQFNKASATTGLTVANTATVISNAASTTGVTAAVNLTGAGATWQINAGFNQSVGSLAGVADSRITLGNAATNLTSTDAIGATFGGVITGAGSFTKAGAGTEVFTGGNAYLGATTINDGTLQIGATNAVQVISDRSAVVIGATGILDLNGNNETIGSLAGVAGGSVTFGAGNLTVGLANTSTDYAGATSGAGGLTKLGTGTQTLSGANTFTGAVNIGNHGVETGGGLIIGVGGSLADTVNIRNAGFNTTFGMAALGAPGTDIVGAVSGTSNTVLALGANATLASTYTDGTPVVGSATMASNTGAGRVVQLNGSITNPQVGMQVTGTGLTAGSYIVQILDANHVLLNQVAASTNTAFAPTATTVGVLSSAITGAGGFTKDGTGLLILTGNSNHTGATTINSGTVQVGGVWDGQKFSQHDTLSDSSALVFAATGTHTLNLAPSTTNLLSFERVGSLAGGNSSGTVNNTTINLTSGGNVAVLAFGGDNTSTTFSGTFLPGSSAGTIIKEGTGTFTWNNPTANTFDGIIEIRAGGFTSLNQGLDGANVVRLSNNNATLTNGVTDTLALIEGGKGVTRVQPVTGFVGALYGNHLTGTGANVVINTGTVMTVSSGTNSGYNGTISGPGGLTKAGANFWQIFGPATLTGETQVTTGTLRTGILSGSAGVGAPTAGLTGTLSSASGLRITGGVLDINGTAQTALRFNASSSSGTVALVNGSLTLADQTTTSAGTAFTGNLGSVVNINASGAATLTLTGNSNAFNGTMNVGTNVAITAGNLLGDASLINLNGTGTQYTVSSSDTIGSLAGTGNATLTGSLTLREARSGTAAATQYSGIASGAGGLLLSNFGGLTISGNNSYAGGTTLSSGSALNLNYGAGSNILPGTGALVLNGGAVRVASSAAVSVLESVVGTNLNAGASRVEALNSITGYTGSGLAALDIGAITRAAGGTIDFGRNAAATSTANVNGILGTLGYATFEGGTWAVGNGSGLAITGLGGGGYSLDAYGAGLNTDVTINGGGATGSLRFNSAGAPDVNAATTLSSGGILVTRNVGANTSTISGALDATGNELIIHQYNPLGDLVLSNVAGTNTIITTAGGGRTQITNNIAGTGATNLGYGYLQLGDATIGGSAAGMVGSGVIRNDGTLGINRSNAQTLGAIISGTGNIEQLGSGTTTLSTANTYQGRTTVRAGTLEVTNTLGLGAAATAVPNRWANLTSVNSGGSLLVNLGGTAAATLTEVLNLDGGTLDLRSTVASTLNAPIVLTSDSTIAVSNAGAAVTHLITGEIFALPGSDLTITNVGGGTPSTVAITPGAVNPARWENTTINAGGRLQIGNNSRGFLGTGAVTNNGELILNINDGNYVVGNAIGGAGNLSTVRNTVHLTADNTYAGTTTVGATGQNAVLRIGNDTYTGSIGSGALTIQSSTAGNSQIRYHLNQDYVVANTVTLNPNADGTTARNADFVKEGLGNMRFTGTLNGGTHVTAPATQRSLVTVGAGGAFIFDGTLTNPVGSEVNFSNGGIMKIEGGISNTYNGVLSGNNVWVFNNSGTTTLAGANTFNTGNTYIRQGTVSLTGGAAIQDDNDTHVLSGATLNIAASETIGTLHTQRGAVVNIAAGQTLTVDDNASQLNAGQFTGTGNLTLAGGNAMVMYPAVANTISGTLLVNQGTIISTNLTNAIGSFAGAISLGSAAVASGLEYIGSGETFAKDITLAGTNTTGNYIAANGTGGLILSGNLTATATNTLRLIGQSGGYFNPIVNRVDGIISEGANVLSVAMPASGNDDRFGVTGRWTLTNASNDFSGNIAVNVGMLEFTQLGTGASATSSMGDQTATRTITLGSDNFDGRRYDSFGTTDQIGAAGAAQGTNTLAPTGNIGTIIFNDAIAGTATFGTNITFAQPSITGANTTGGQLINNGAKVVVINGALVSGTTGNKQWILDGSNTGTNTINGLITNPTTSQTTSIIKEGAGTWRINQSATGGYTGTTTVNNGILEISGGEAIPNGGLVALNGDGGDGIFSGTAKVVFVGSETIGTLTGDVLTEAEILAGQTLTIAGGNSTMNGLITGAGNLSRTVSGATAGTLTTSAKNTYTGVTTIGAVGAATSSAGLTIYHIADGGVASGLGASSNAASNLVFASIAGSGNGNVLTWQGFTNQSTDRLFTVGEGTRGTELNASGTVVGTTAPTMTFSNTGSLSYTGTAARTLILSGGTISDNTFRPLIADSTGATTLSKAGTGLWLVNPDVAGNSYSGGTSITGGTLAIQAGNALGAGTITINGGGGVGLEIRGAGITLANAITNSTAEGGIIVRGGTNLATGLATLTTNIRIGVDAGASLEFNNAVSSLTGAGALQKFGAGNLILSGTNGAGFTGATIVRGGTLTLDYNTNNTSKLADAAALTLGTAGGVTMPGVDGEVAGASNLFGTTGGAIVLGGATGSHVEQVSATNLNQGASSISRSGANTATINLENITRIPGGTIDFGAASLATTNNFNGVQNATVAHNILNTTGGGVGTHTGAYATINKTDWATTAAAGTDVAITAIAAGAYNNGGIIETFGAGFNTDIISAAAVTTGAVTGTLRFNATQASTLTLGAAFGVQGTAVGLNSGGILVTPTVGAFTSIINGAALQNSVATAALDLIIHQHNTAGALQIDSVIQNNTATNAQGLTKTGAGKLFLNGLNTYTGVININEGEIQVGGYLSGLLATPAANANAGINMSEGATLRFLTTNTTVYNSGVIQGGGAIIMDVGNAMPLRLDDDNGNYFGSITVNQGTIEVAAANALGSNRGITTIGALGTLQMNTAVNSPELITYLQGANVTGLPVGGATLSGKQTLSNSTTGGLTFNMVAPTTAGTVGVNVTGIMYGSNGFTKSGNGILQISAINFADVYDGYTGINKTATLSGQIAVNGGILYVGGARALGAHGAGNEVIVASGASLDLRGNALNYGDDSDLTRKLIEISGTGAVNAQANPTGALRNTTGTGQTAFLKLNAASTINTGGLVNASALIVGTFDSNLSNANALTNAFTRNRPVIAGGGFDLTVQGGRNATDNFVIADPTFSSALGNLIIREGGARLRHEVTAALSPVGLTGADITGAIQIGYGGVTAADLTGLTAAGSGGTFLGANVGARFLFENYYGTHHTVDITMDGTTAAAANAGSGGTFSLAGGQNYLSVDFFTIPDGTTYLDGDLNLTGAALRNIIANDSIGNYTVTEQGNLTISPATKLVIGGVAQGAGGFTKNGQAEVRFTNTNTFTGDVNVVRFGAASSPFESHTYKINGVDYATNGDGEGWGEYSLTLNGAAGAFTGVGNINLERRGMITLDNTTRLAATSGTAGGNNNNRINDAAVINLNHGWLRLNTGTLANTEILGTVNVNAGSNILDIYGTDGAGVATDLTVTTLNRAAGGVLRITNLDASSTFSTAIAGDSTRLTVGTLGAGAALIGGGGAANSTTMSVVQGVLGGNAPISLTTDLRILGFSNGNVSDLMNQERNIQFASGSHFMTQEGGFTRPLDNDEYFTPSNGLLNPTTLGGTTQNVNLSDVFTIVSQNSTINSLRLGALTDHDGTGATGAVDHHAINVNVDGTLTIGSGMISSAYWTVGNTSDATTRIWGGTLDFNAKEAIINNQNAFLRLTDGTIQGGSINIGSAITNAVGLTKTGFQRVILDGANTYTGVTIVSEGILDLRNGRTAAGVGGAGNGIVVVGAGELRTNNGVIVGTPGAREDIYVGVLQAANQVMRVESDVTVWNSNLIIDNVDVSGQVIFTPIVRTDNTAVSILNGNVGGGNTAVSNDVLAMDPRRLSFNSAGNNLFVVNGQFGDRLDGSGNAVPIADVISQLPTIVGTRTNENEVLRVDLGGASLETSYILNRQYNAAGRLTLESGVALINYDPTAGGLDGTGFWTNTAISKIPGANSTSTAFTVNGGTTFQGFQLGSTTASGINNGNTALFLTRAGQTFNMATWSTTGTGAKYIGGINESGIVTYGDGTGTLNIGGAIANLQAADGGTVVFRMNFAGAIGSVPSNFNFLKQGRGTVELQNSTAGATSTDSNFVLAGGTLLLNHTAATSVALVGTQNSRFDGGRLISVASTGANTTDNFTTDNNTNRELNFSVGGTEIVARTASAGTARNMVINMGNGNANGTNSNFLRGLGATANLVEDNTAGATAQITLQFNASTTAARKNAVIPWATFGTLSRTAADFAMSDAGAGNDVRAFGRAADELNNNVATWNADGDISENGGAGFNGTLAGPLTLSTLRFDTNADSTVNLGTNVLTVAGNGLTTSGGGILVSSNVGAANKTITGGAGAGLTTSGGRVELILHHYGTGNLNVNVPITGAGVDLVIAGPSTTNADTIGTTGAVVLGAANTYDGQTFINGSVLSFSNANQLGTNNAANGIQMNGGTLRYTGSGLATLGSTRGIVFNGNGGTLDVTDGEGQLYVDGLIDSNALYRGDMIKVGAGTLTLNGNGGNNAGFSGVIDVRQGTLRINGDVGNNNAGTITPLGTTNSYVDGTIFRTGTNFAIQLGNANDSGDFNLDEWLTFAGNNYVSVGTQNTQTGNVSTAPGFAQPNNERPVNLNGLITIDGTTTFDVVSGQTLRLNNNGTLMTTGNGTMIKDGQGTMVLQTNNPNFTGAITILQGRFQAVGQADVLGTGYTVANGSKVITLGSDSRQGIAELTITSDNIQGNTTELNHAVNVVYNPAQAKRLTFETFANGANIEVNGNITLNDNLNLYINDAAETGGSANYVNINSLLLDGATTSGNLLFHSDEADGTASNATNGRTYNFLVLKNNNSGWTGDVRVNANTGYDQDQTGILRLENANALTAANDVDMGFNSMLQVGGGARTIGSLSTNGGVGPFIGDTAGGTMGAQANGTTVVIENAASSAGTLTITQSTPVSTEVVWNAYFRNGTLNSEFFAPGAGPVAAAALSVVKAGSGWATIANDNNYTGSTLVTNGTLQVGRLGVGDTGATTAAGFTSNAGTTVAGTGTIQGTTLINGALRPGDEAGGLMGTLVVNGGLTLGATSTTSLQLQRSSYTAFNVLNIHDALYSGWNSATATDPTYSHLLNDPVLNTQHDKVIVTGGLTFTAGGKITLANQGYNPTAGDIINVLDWTGGAVSLNLGGVAYNGGLFRTGGELGTDLDLFQLGNGFLYDLSQFNSTGNIIVVQGIARQFYWNGDVDSNWNTNTLGNTNWLNAPAGTDPAGLPTLTDDVFFTATAAANFATTLGASFAINTLNFGAGANNTTSATIDTGANSLTLYGGINQVTGSAANTISSSGAGGVVLAQNQTWTNNSLNNLTVSAPVSGTANLTSAGAGRTILSGTNTYVGTTTVAAGNTLQIGAGGTTGTLGTGAVTNNGTLEFNRSNTYTVANNISGTGAVNQAGTGTTDVTGTNSYTGATGITAGTLAVTGSLSGTNSVSINSGTLLLNNSNVINDAANVTMTNGTLNTGGRAETLGTLNLTLNTTSILDLGSLNTNNALRFGNSSGNSWTGALQIWNWTGTSLVDGGGFGGAELDQVFFGTDSTGLTGGQLSTITFFSDAGGMNLGSAVFGSAGQIVPVPEPASTALLGSLALCALIGYRERRRFTRKPSENKENA